MKFQALYERLFEWLIKYINKILSREAHEQINKLYQTSLIIGVLDIYGFEIFENNRYYIFYFKKYSLFNLVLNNYV